MAAEEILLQGADESAPAHRAAFALALLMPWMLLFTRVGAEICTAGIGLLFLWHSWRSSDWAWARTPFMRVALLAWLWLMLVVSPLALNPEKSFFFALPWVRYVLLFAALRHWVLAPVVAPKRLGASVALMLLYVALDTLWQYHTGHSFAGHPIAANDRLTGPFLTPKVGIFIARFILPLVLIAAWLHVQRTPRLSLACIGIALLSLSAIVLTGERTALAMSLGSILIGCAFIGYRAHALRRSVSIFVSTILILVGGLYVTQPSVQNTLTRASGHVAHFKESPYGQVFSAAFEVGRTHWRTGVGMQGLRELTPPAAYVEGGDVQMREHFIHAHNPYLEWFAEAGLPGLMLFMAMVAALVREALLGLMRARGAAVIAPAAMLAACAFHFFPIMSTQSYFSNWTGITIWYCLGGVFAGVHWMSGVRTMQQENSA